MTEERRKLSLFSPRRRSSAEAGGSGGTGSGHGSDQAEEPGQQLDEEMEKVFSGLSKSQFSASSFAEASPRRSSAFAELDYSMHRKKSYPHTHVPLKTLRPPRRSISAPRSESEAQQEEGASGSRKMSEIILKLDTGQSTPPLTEPLQTSDSLTGTSPPTILSQADDEDSGSVVEEGIVTPDGATSQHISNLSPGADTSSEPQVSERAAITTTSTLPETSSDRRVQFIIGKPSSADDDSPLPSSPLHSTVPDDELLREELDVIREGDFEKRPKRKHRHHHHHHHHHKSRKFSLQDDLVGRKRLGSDFALRDSRRTSVQAEEAVTLQEQDIDDLTSHRFEDPRGLRRPKLKSQLSTNSVVHIGRKHDSSAAGPFKKSWDHSPHEVFVQLDELHGEGDEREWKETARWIKYEEDVMEGSDRWGRPHVASLSFHSLLNLRRCLENGVVLLDLDERDLPGVAYRVVEQMVTDELIDPEDRATVMRALLLRHRHVNDGGDRFRFGMRRNVSSYTSLQNLTEEKGKPRIVPSASATDAAAIAAAAAAVSTGIKHTLKNNSFSEQPSEAIIDIKEELTYGSSSEDLKKVQKESILKRIPLGAEATTVLVGAVDFLEQPTIAFVRLAEGIYMPSLTEVTIPVRFLFILLGPNTCDLDYHEIGRSISTLMANEHFHKVAYKADERKELLSAINEFLDDSIVLPPGDWERKALLPFGELKAKSEMIRRRKSRKVELDQQQVGVLQQAVGPPPPPDPLIRTRKPFGGLLNDIKRRMPLYMSDIVDGLNAQCLAAAIFMYFAAVSGAITFGGLIGDKTENLIGISETLVSTSTAGIIFALLSGQPMIVIGATGPLLLFDESLYSFCLMNNVDFLAVRVYIGFWIFIIALVVVAFEGSVLVKLFTRFTEEIFAALISVLYIVEAFVKLYMVYLRHPFLNDYCNFPIIENNLTDIVNETITENPFFETELEWNETTESSNITVLSKIQHDIRFNQPNTALFCTILAFGTFFIAYYLRQFRNSKFLGRSARRALGDFGVPIAIISMVTLDYLNPQVYTEKLKVPEGLSPTNEAVRGWIIPPGTLSQPWIAFAAIAPAALVYILLFMETHICELIIDKKERKLKKGSGFHLDIVLVSLLNVGCGLIGAPWVCAATVRSISHVSALTVLSRTHAPGDAPHIIEVKEQRLSALLVSVLIGLSVLMAPLLRLVPISVLFGVFLYMGISSMNGIQFFDRLQLFFMPVKHHPQAAYVRKVHSMKMHLFTMIQLMCLAILWVVKSTQASLAFPFFLILMVPLRAQLRFIFTPSELRALDSEEADDDKEDDEPDFYTEAPLAG